MAQARACGTQGFDFLGNVQIRARAQGDQDVGPAGLQQLGDVLGVELEIDRASDAGGLGAPQRQMRFRHRRQQQRNAGCAIGQSAEQIGRAAHVLHKARIGPLPHRSGWVGVVDQGQRRALRLAAGHLLQGTEHAPVRHESLVGRGADAALVSQPGDGMRCSGHGRAGLFGVRKRQSKLRLPPVSSLSSLLCPFTPTLPTQLMLGPIEDFAGRLLAQPLPTVVSQADEDAAVHDRGSLAAASLPQFRAVSAVLSNLATGPRGLSTPSRSPGSPIFASPSPRPSRQSIRLARHPGPPPSCRLSNSASQFGQCSWLRYSRFK